MTSDLASFWISSSQYAESRITTSARNTTPFWRWLPRNKKAIIMKTWVTRRSSSTWCPKGCIRQSSSAHKSLRSSNNSILPSTKIACRLPNLILCTGDPDQQTGITHSLSQVRNRVNKLQSIKTFPTLNRRLRKTWNQVLQLLTNI